jgi:aspartate carbamoyltransferase catalytic subunit
MMTWTKRGLLGIADLDRGALLEILDAAQKYKEGGETPQALAGRRVVTLFFEPSSRTKLSFQIAARRLGAEVVDFPTATSSVKKGESLKDTVLTLQAMGLDALIVRHPSSGAPAYIANLIAAPVVNAGDGSHEHPTQALVDLLTIRERFERFGGLTVAMVGDMLHSRVARSNLLAHRLFGNRIVLVGPPTLIPDDFRGPHTEISYELDPVLPHADVVIMLRIQHERMREQFFPSIREYARLFGLNARRQERLRKGALVMHPGPMNRDIEIVGAVADGPHAAIARQVAHGVYVRQAILALLSGAGRG